MKITGTFLDEISHDIPSSNWGRKEWAKDFDEMKAIGIDTVILIRAGYKNKLTFDSESLKKYIQPYPVYIDLVDLFLEQAERCGMNFYFGLYDSGEYWHKGDYKKELEINKELAKEVAEKYGERKAFKGWYASHELSVHDEDQLSLVGELCEELKSIKNIPILISPYVKGRMQFEDPITLEEHEAQWDQIFSALSGKVDIVAFQDGQVDFFELEDFSRVNKKLADQHGIESWANVESFERGMPINFLPIDWRNLKMKMDVAQKVGVSKLITFEFSHFMSPNSIYPSAHFLLDRYREFTKL
ncbi:DUF4434 domain-containing protein [Marinifilum caeruleilacunae]|uniref:DUF4434 domain-containing protein n=1 Tax=Marinifilum caeruleilacunae TaxID=2499076 RepID=A0ABX1X007_9BACT|nr:DUF4434 domain-containing protein [Marinifilum caeruleilacunae]NOU61415.1 DUF4434 domain-containing protein [Marinifilum caeruleilacunae]